MEYNILKEIQNDAHSLGAQQEMVPSRVPLQIK
jgi:hypothetical protein